MKVKLLKNTHPEYDHNLIKKYDLLYEGGSELLKNVVLFLPRRHREAQKIYSERSQRAFYIGYVGPIIDYFSSNLFALEPNIKRSKTSEETFYNNFLENVDLKKSTFTSFFKYQFIEALKHQSSYILIDFPMLSDLESTPKNRLEEDALGLSRAYLVPFKKDNLIDWQYDGYGNFEWVKFQVEDRYKPSFDSEEVERYRWYIYNKTGFQIYEFLENEATGIDSDNEQAESVLIASGEHAVKGEVPITCLEVPKGLWVMNKLASIQIEIFNLDNALAWQEYQGHFAMPIIKLKDNKSFNQRMGESYYIRLDIDEDFEWSEPDGKMMEVGLKRREMLKDELFRIIHQMSLSIQQTNTQTKQSGQSKQEDRYATEIILRAFGDIMRETMQGILDKVSEARGDKIDWDVSGFSIFDNESVTEKLAQKLQLKALGLHSETFLKENEKRIVDLVLEDANIETKNKIKSEIESFDFQEIINDPLSSSFGGYGMAKPQGISKPSQRPEKPNNTNKV